MITGRVRLPSGMDLRPAAGGDRRFLERLRRQRRDDDLRMAHADRAYVEGLIDMQLAAQAAGYGAAFPNAMYLVIEKLGERIGRLTLDWDGAGVRIVELGFVRQAQGKGYGKEVVLALMAACGQARTPLLATLPPSDVALRAFLVAHGFAPEDEGGAFDRLVWQPTAPPRVS